MEREKKDSYEPIFIRGTAVGVVLCILAVIPTIIAESMEASDYYCGLSVGLLLFILAIGVNLLVRVGMVKSSYDTLLQEGEYTKEEKLFKKKTDTFSGVYCCLTTAIYLAWSFWTMSDIIWIVWPVAGVLSAALLGGENGVKERQQNSALYLRWSKLYFPCILYLSRKSNLFN